MSIETQTAIIPIPTADLPATTAIIDNNVNQSNSNSNRTSSTSPSKARRRRKRNNKNKNKNKNMNQGNNSPNKSNQNTDSTKSNTKSNKKKRQKPKQTMNTNTNATTKPINTKLDRVELLNKGKKNPWSKKQQSSAFENIMSEQAQTKKPNYNHIQPQIDEQALLEQQMLAMAIAASKKEQQEEQLKEYQKYSNKQNNANENGIINEQNGNDNDDEKQLELEQTNNIEKEDEEKQITEDKPSINDELIAATINAQSNINSNVKLGDETLSDEALAIQLQQQEQREYNRRQKMSQIYDGKYAKVTSSATKPTTVPKAALNFYYDDKSMLNGGLTKEQYQQHLMTTQASEESIIDENGNVDAESGSIATTEQTELMEEELEAISKHDAKIWSEKHMERLNEYEVGGNLNMNMNIGNQAYNSFRNQLDKKHFITYHNYQLEPADRKR